MGKSKKKKQDLTAIIYGIKDTKEFLQNKPYVTRVFPLTPDAYSSVINKTSIEIIHPLERYNDKNHKKVVSDLRNAEKIISPLINSSKYLSKAGKETFKNIFHPSFSKALYILYLINNTQPWIIYENGKWKKTKDHFEVVRKILFQDIDAVYGKNEKFTQKFQSFTNYINERIIKSKIKYKNIWTTGLVYGQKNLTINLKKIDKNVVFFQFSTVDKFSIIRTIRSIFSLLRVIGIKAPVKPATNKFSIMAKAITNPSKRSLNQ